MAGLSANGLTVRFGHGSGALTAVKGVDIEVAEGRTMGLVGESGSGKSTLGRAIVQLVKASAGQVFLDGRDVTRLSPVQVKEFRSQVQMVFQDPYSSLNPRMTVGETIEEAISAHRSMSARQRADEVARLLALVAMDPQMADRYPHQLSGGQRQRIAIARALAVQPSVMILDEVTSSVDVSVQANTLNLLRELQRSLGLSYLFISHNLSVVRYMSDSVSVMYLGTVVERAPTQALFAHPAHPYTRALVDSVPRLRVPARAQPLRLAGEIPDPRHPPSGCRFRTRCPVGPAYRPDRRICAEVDPLTTAARGKYFVACHFPL
jgi:peptide/nickel transport system ATP-binding protein